MLLLIERGRVGVEGNGRQNLLLTGLILSSHLFISTVVNNECPSPFCCERVKTLLLRGQEFVILVSTE